MKKGIYIYSRRDERTGRVYFQGRDYKLHLAGKEDDSLGWDKFLFTAGNQVLGENEGEKFKKNFNSIMDYMSEINKIGEITKDFSPLLILYTNED